MRGPDGYGFFCFPFVFLLFFFCFTHSFVSVFLLSPGEGVPTWTLSFVRGTWHQDQRREWKPSKRLYGYWVGDMYSALD